MWRFPVGPKKISIPVGDADQIYIEGLGIKSGESLNFKKGDYLWFLVLVEDNTVNS